MFFKKNKKKKKKKSASLNQENIYQQGMSKSRSSFGSKIGFLFRSRKNEKELFNELEDLLVISDTGIETARNVTAEFKEIYKERNLVDSEDIVSNFKEYLISKVEKISSSINVNSKGLTILAFIGVNGSGKTTTVGKMAHQLSAQGKKVMVAAADTFRAAAVEQLVEWATRADVPIIKQSTGADPGAVVFDAISSAQNKGIDFLLIDTAGRFHNRKNLVRELQKIDKIVKSKISATDLYQKIIVLDGTAGGNSFTQAVSFNEAVELDGAVITKMDSSAKGGVVITLADRATVPVLKIGFGESANDLVDFDASKFVLSLFEE